MDVDATRILVSDCLLGVPCRYDGRSKGNDAVQRLCAQAEVVVGVCPECAGGLPTPRLPSEIVGDRVLMRDGTDVTAEFELGARRCCSKALEAGITLAILKAKSPSCGSGQVYDGTFSGTLVPGNGHLTQLLREAAIPVVSEEDVERELVQSHHDADAGQDLGEGGVVEGADDLAGAGA